MRQLKIGRSITNRTEGNLDKYLSDISREDLLTVDEEVELAQRIHKGDAKALERLVNCNLRFVVSVAKQYQNQGLSLSDLIDEGNIGLIKAAQKFDETKGFKFISYAVWWIRQGILSALAEQSRMVRLPLNQVGVLSRVNKINASFEQENGRKPSSEEIANELGEDVDRIEQLLRTNSRHVSIDAPLNTDGDNDNTLANTISANVIGPDESMEKESLSAELERYMKHILHAKEMEILKRAASFRSSIFHLFMHFSAK